MYGCRCLNIFMISVFLAFFLLFSLPTPCLAQSSAKDRVNTLYQKYRQLQQQGHYQEAIEYAKELIPAGEEAFGKDHPNVAVFLSNLAGLYGSLGDYSKAEPVYKRSLAIREKALGPEHPHLAASLNNLATLYDSLGDYARAEPLYKRALAIDEKVLGPEHPDVAIDINSLAGLYYTLGITPRQSLYTKGLLR